MSDITDEEIPSSGELYIHAIKTIADLRERLAVLREALEWYATATYPDDGSGRPPNVYQERARRALEQT